MNNFRFHTPTEVVFGKGVEMHTGALAAKHGTRALVVYGKGSVVKSGLLALDATANDTLRLSRIRPLNAKDVEAIYRLAMTFPQKGC